MAYYPSGPVNPNLPTTYNNQPNFQPASQQQEAPKNEIPWGKITIGIVVVVVICLLTGIIELPSTSTVSTTGSDKGSGTGTGTGKGSGTGTGTGTGRGSGSSGSAPPSVPKVYTLPPIYYSETFGAGVTPFGGKMRQSSNNKAYVLNAGCPAGTSVIPLMNSNNVLNPNGPKAGYYAHVLNKNTPKGGTPPSSCPTSMNAGRRPLDNNILKSFANIGADGTITLDNSDFNKIWNYAPCDGYYKTLQLDLSCAENGIDPGADATIVPYTPTNAYPNFQGFANRFISRY
jgi:hypothetical protein